MLYYIRKNEKLTNSPMDKDDISSKHLHNCSAKNKGKASKRCYINFTFSRIFIGMFFILFYQFLQFNNEESIRFWLSKYHSRRLAQHSNETNSGGKNEKTNIRKLYGDEIPCKNIDTSSNDVSKLCSNMIRQIHKVNECIQSGNDINMCIQNICSHFSDNGNEVRFCNTKGNSSYSRENNEGDSESSKKNDASYRFPFEVMGMIAFPF